MKTRWMVSVVVGLLVVAGSAQADTAAPYRGPVGELPRANVGPQEYGLIGAERFAGRARYAEGLSRWEFWWELNRREFLAGARGEAEAARADLAMNLFATPHDRVAVVGEDDVRQRIIPVLMRRLADGDPEMRARAALALGRARESAAFAPLAELLSRGAGPDRAAAALALGMLGEPLAARTLIEFVRSAGIPARDRAFGALALGLLGDEAGAPTLRELLSSSSGLAGNSIEDLQAASATALGLLGDRLAVPVLTRLAGNHNGRADTVRSAAVLALGRIGARSSTPALMQLLGDHDVDVRRAAAQALGLLKDEGARDALAVAFRQDPDVQVKSFAAVSIARLAGPQAKALLAEGLDPRAPRALRGFSALAVGILGDPSGAELLRPLLEVADEASVGGAAAVGLALLRDAASLPRLRDIVRDARKDDDFRGYSLLAVAMMGDPLAWPLVGAAATDRSSANLRRAAMDAASLFPGRPGGRLVLAGLFEETDPFVRGAAAQSLALVPRRQVVDPLVTVAGERGFSMDAAKDAVSALGILARRGADNPLERFLASVNYRSLTASGAYLLALL